MYTIYTITSALHLVNEWCAQNKQVHNTYPVKQTYRILYSPAVHTLRITSSAHTHNRDTHEVHHKYLYATLLSPETLPETHTHKFTL